MAGRYRFSTREAAREAARDAVASDANAVVGERVATRDIGTCALDAEILGKVVGFKISKHYTSEDNDLFTPIYEFVADRASDIPRGCVPELSGRGYVVYEMYDAAGRVQYYTVVTDNYNTPWRLERGGSGTFTPRYGNARSRMRQGRGKLSGLGATRQYTIMLSMARYDVPLVWGKVGQIAHAHAGQVREAGQAGDRYLALVTFFTQGEMIAAERDFRRLTGVRASVAHNVAGLGEAGLGGAGLALSGAAIVAGAVLLTLTRRKIT